MEARGRIARLGEARHALDVSAETVEPLLRHGGNEGGAVLEVPLRRCMGHADAPGYLAQGELRAAALLDQGEGGFYQGLAQVSVVIPLPANHFSHPSIGC